MGEVKPTSRTESYGVTVVATMPSCCMAAMALVQLELTGGKGATTGPGRAHDSQQGADGLHSERICLAVQDTNRLYAPVDERLQQTVHEPGVGWCNPQQQARNLGRGKGMDRREKREHIRQAGKSPKNAHLL